MTKKKSEISTVRFSSPHTHAGTQYQKGDEIEADPGLVARLKKIGVIDGAHVSPLATQSKGDKE